MMFGSVLPQYVRVQLSKMSSFAVITVSVGKSVPTPLRNLGRWESKSQRPKLKRRIPFCQVLEIGSETRPAVLYSHYLRDVVVACLQWCL